MPYFTALKIIELDNGTRYIYGLLKGCAQWCNLSGTFCNERQHQEILTSNHRTVHTY